MVRRPTFYRSVLLLWPAWLLLVWSTSGQELIAGAVSALLVSAAIAFAFNGPSSNGLSPAVELVRRLPLLPWQVLRGTAQVFWALRRPAQLRRRGAGRMLARPLSADGSDLPEIRLRAVEIWVGSFAPDEYVVCLELGTGRVVIHQFPPRHETASVAPGDVGAGGRS